MPEMLTVEEAAERLRLAPMTVRKKIKAGDLGKCSKVGREWRIPASAVDAAFKGDDDTAKAAS